MLVIIYIFFLGGGMLNIVGMKIGYEEKKNLIVIF